METIKSLTEQVAAATGSKKAQLVLKNARIVNVFTQSVEEGDIAIEEGRIVGIGTYDGVMESDLKGAYICSGFFSRAGRQSYFCNTCKLRSLFILSSYVYTAERRRPYRRGQRRYRTALQSDHPVRML